MQLNSLTISGLVLLLCLTCNTTLRAQGNWSHRLPIIITNTSGLNMIDYQTLIIIDSQTPIIEGKMKIDCSDIRFSNSCEESNFLPYWIESGINTDSTRIWVKISLIPTTDTIIFMLYGNSLATSQSNGDSTFVFFDDFMGSTLDTTKWSTHGHGTISISNSSIQFITDSNKIIKTKTPFPSPLTAEMKLLNTSGNFISLAQLLSSSWYGYSLTILDSTKMYLGHTDTNCLADSYSIWLDTVSTSDGTQGIWKIKWPKRGLINAFWPSDSLTFLDSTYSLGNINVALGQIDSVSSCYPIDTGISSVDWVRIRQHSSTEPVVLIQNVLDSVQAIFAFFPDNQGNVQFTNSSINATDFNWCFDDGLQSTMFSPLHSYVSAGIYNVTLEAYNTCFADTALASVNVVINNLINIDTHSGIKVFPNPSRKTIYLQIKQYQNENPLIKLYNTLNQLVYSEKLTVHKTNIYKIEILTLPSGFYSLIVETKTQIQVFKVIIN